MKKLVFLLTFTIVHACELIDPTEVVNPNVSEDTFLGLPRIATSWHNGLERQLAITMNQTVVLGELLSDNYYNNRTLSNKVFDIPQINHTDVDVLAWQSEIHQLRTMAEYALEVVRVEDESTTNAQLAEFYFFLGLAHLFSGEYFTGLPAEEGGEVLAPATHFSLAEEALLEALSLGEDADKQLGYHLALARVYHRLGMASEAAEQAQRVISADPLFVRQVAYDINLRNDMQFYLYDSEANEFAPLPRLDFLDPKYFYRENPSLEQKPIALLKAEEAYLILAEAQLSEGNMPQARTTLVNLLTQSIAYRPTATFTDPDNRDGGSNLTVGIPPYPLSSAYEVLASPEAAPRSGLVLERPGTVTVPTVSGTSVTEDMLNAATTVDDLLEFVYLMRQEIFIAEGRRVVDLGIKIPVADNEFTGNDNVTETHLIPQIPDFYPDENYAFDRFTLDATDQQVTVLYNLNNILIENKESDLVIPFF